MGCIAASRDVLPPLIVAPDADDAKIYDLGWRPNEDVVIRHAVKCYVTKEILFDCKTSLLIPYIDNLRGSTLYQNEIAVLLMDNASVHYDEELNALCGAHKILILTFPPHTSQIFQPLDLCLFSAFKAEKGLLKPELPRNSREGQIVLLIEAWEKSSVSRNVRKSFHCAGITIDQTEGSRSIFPLMSLGFAAHLDFRSSTICE
jgi:hypothetical protein